MIDFLSHMHFTYLNSDRIPVAMLALAITAAAGVVTGPSHGNANPALWALMERLIGGIGGRLDRRERTARDLLTRGFATTIVGLLLAAAIGFAADGARQAWPMRGITEILLLSFTLAGGTVWYALLKLYFALQKGKLSKGAYYTIARSLRVDLANADDYTITRIGMGFAARSFDKAVVSPVFWYLLMGLPGAYIYAGLVALAWRFGREGFTKGFGKTALALERLLGFVPGLLAGVLMALAGLFTPTGGMTRALAALLQYKKGAPYAEGGLPLTAMANALDVSLGGPVTDLDGSTIKRHWIGPEGATAQLEAGHLRRALYISLMAYLLFMASLMGAAVWGARLFH